MIFDNKDFTLHTYGKLCEAIVRSNYKALTFRDYLREKPSSGGIIILRHDIDENARFALDLAKVEHDHGLKASYYFRNREKVFVPRIMDEIISYGHEIGYHYETLDQCNGNVELAIKKFAEDLEYFRKRYDVKTVCMHGNPMSKYDNRDIWKKCSLADFNLMGEPYLSLDYKDFMYFSDSGRSWSQEKYKIKDTIKDRTVLSVKNTFELISLIDQSYPANICVLTHPERWNSNAKDYLARYAKDTTFKAGKKVIVLARGSRR